MRQKGPSKGLSEAASKRLPAPGAGVGRTNCEVGSILGPMIRNDKDAARALRVGHMASASFGCWFVFSLLTFLVLGPVVVALSESCDTVFCTPGGPWFESLTAAMMGYALPFLSWPVLIVANALAFMLFRFGIGGPLAILLLTFALVAPMDLVFGQIFGSFGVISAIGLLHAASCWALLRKFVPEAFVAGGGPSS